MKVIAWIRALFTPDRSVADANCPDCYGSGFDASGQECACVERR